MKQLRPTIEKVPPSFVFHADIQITEKLVLLWSCLLPYDEFSLYHHDLEVVLGIGHQTLKYSVGRLDISRFPHTHQFGQKPFGLIGMLKHVCRDHEIERLVSEWHTVGVSDDQRPVLLQRYAATVLTPKRTLKQDV